MMREPPAEPSTSAPPPSGPHTIVGDIDDNMRLPGAMALASPCTSPNMFAAPGAIEKSSISSFSTNPRPGTVTPLPNQALIVVVIATAVPSASTTDKCVVCGPAFGAGVESGQKC